MALHCRVLTGATMVYMLTCGNCLLDSYVKSDVLTAIDWVCPLCDNENSSSLPTENQVLITDHTKTKSLLSAEEEKHVKDVVVGKDPKDPKVPKDLPVDPPAGLAKQKKAVRA